MWDSEPLVTIEELRTYLPFELDTYEEGEANLALESLSDEARFYGSSAWATPESAPKAVKNLILKAANRHMKNYEGLIQSRAGDETLGWDGQGQYAGSARFTDAEQNFLKSISGSNYTFGSAPTTAWNTTYRPHTWDCRGNPTSDQWVPTESGTLFPWLAGD